MITKHFRTNATNILRHEKYFAIMPVSRAERRDPTSHEWAGDGFPPESPERADETAPPPPASPNASA